MTTPGIFAGFAAPFLGLRWIAERRTTWHLCAAPLLIGAILYALLGWQTVHIVRGIANSIATQGAMRVLAWIIAIASGIAVALIAMIFFTTLVGVLAAPFCERLSQAVEREAGLTPTPAPFGFALRETIKIVGFALIVGLPLGLLQMIPIAGWLFVPVAFGFTVLNASLGYLDYPLLRRGMTFGQKLSYVARRPGMSLGFGLVVASWQMVPLLGLLCIPSATVAATQLALADGTRLNQSGSPSTAW